MRYRPPSSSPGPNRPCDDRDECRAEEVRDSCRVEELATVRVGKDATAVAPQTQIASLATSLPQEAHWGISDSVREGHSQNRDREGAEGSCEMTGTVHYDAPAAASCART
jgi:hypothetical protein